MWVESVQVLLDAELVILLYLDEVMLPVGEVPHHRRS